MGWWCKMIFFDGMRDFHENERKETGDGTFKKQEPQWDGRW